jgi:hypothetical protein
VSTFEEVMLRRLQGDQIPSRTETIKRDLAARGEAYWFLPSEWDDALIGYTAPEPVPLYEFRKLVEIRMKQANATREQQQECEREVGEMLAHFDPDGKKISVAIVYGHIR